MGTLSSADWFARRLGNPPPTPSAPAAPQPRRDVWPSATPPPPAYTKPEYQGPPTDENGQVKAGDAIANWKGGAGVAASQRAGGCPNCNSGNYFPMGQAAPRCFDCGYPTMQGEMNPHRS